MSTLDRLEQLFNKNKPVLKPPSTIRKLDGKPTYNKDVSFHNYVVTYSVPKVFDLITDIYIRYHKPIGHEIKKDYSVDWIERVLGLKVLCGDKPIAEYSRVTYDFSKELVRIQLKLPLSSLPYQDIQIQLFIETNVKQLPLESLMRFSPLISSDSWIVCIDGADINSQDTLAWTECKNKLLQF